MFKIWRSTSNGGREFLIAVRAEVVSMAEARRFSQWGTWEQSGQWTHNRAFQLSEMLRANFCPAD